jgi:hypothetical protein
MNATQAERRANAHNGKIVHWSEAEANDALDEMTAKGQWGLAVYPCSYGGIGPHWHIGRSITGPRGRRP